jgi:hypothetical protein
MEVKTKFYCKTTQSVSIDGLKSFKDQFIKGKWYDGAYETWGDQLYKLNNGWRSYWVIDESGEKIKMNRVKMRIIFELDKSELMDKKINTILDGR